MTNQYKLVWEYNGILYTGFFNFTPVNIAVGIQKYFTVYKIQPKLSEVEYWTFQWDPGNNKWVFSADPNNLDMGFKILEKIFDVCKKEDINYLG